MVGSQDHLETPFSPIPATFEEKSQGVASRAVAVNGVGGPANPAEDPCENTCIE